MRTLLSVGILVVLWIINLINGTGFDAAYHITDLCQYVVLGSMTIGTLFRAYKTKHLFVKKTDFYVFGGMAFLFLVSTFVNGRGVTAIDYLWVYFLIFLVGCLKISEKVFFWTSLMYGALGAAILVIYNYGSALSGWNDNSIAMIGMYSFLILMIPFFKKTNTIKNKCLLLLLTAVFAFLLDATDCRSGMLFLFIGTGFAIDLIPRRWIVQKKSRMYVLLWIPLIIAIIVSAISNTELANTLNIWSYKTFQKPIFNGRDELWIRGFEVLFENLFIGTGNLSYANWHNSAVTCLVAFGSVGFILWIESFNLIFAKARVWIKDYLVCGCIISFMVLYIQQSVELGFISSSPNLLPYVMLGMMLGRIRYLKQ